MSTENHAADHQEVHQDVNDTIITRLFGIALAIGVAYALHALVPVMGWHPIVGGILTGASGVLMGALGTSTPGPTMAAILGWAGGTNFILGLLLFVIH